MYILLPQNDEKIFLMLLLSKKYVFLQVEIKWNVKSTKYINSIINNK